MTDSFPQKRIIRALEERRMLREVRRLWGHDATGPSGVPSQAIDRITRPISPPTGHGSSGRINFSAVLSIAEASTVPCPGSLQQNEPINTNGTNGKPHTTIF